MFSKNETRFVLVCLLLVLCGCKNDGRAVAQQKGSNLGNVHVKVERPLDSYEEVDLETLILHAHGQVPQAMVELGLRYVRANGIEKDVRKSIPWYRRAAELGDPAGQFWLGIAYRSDSDNGLDRDGELALKYLKQAASQDYLDAYHNIGLMYVLDQDEDIVEKDFKEAIKWFKLGEEKNAPWSLSNLGLIYRKGLYGETKNDEKSFHYYKRGAELGQASDMNWVGYYYMNGIGVDTNLDEGIRWYRLAAENGEKYGMYHLAHCYFDGEGVKKDSKEGMKWLRRAAKNGHKESQQELNSLAQYNNYEYPAYLYNRQPNQRIMVPGKWNYNGSRGQGANLYKSDWQINQESRY